MVSDQIEVNLANLGNGAALEKFDHELGVVLENIMDPNTDLKAREITLKVKIVPTKDRTFSGVEISCKSKLSAAETICSQMFIGYGQGGHAKAFEHNPEQTRMNFDEEKKEPDAVINNGNVTAIRQ